MTSRRWLVLALLGAAAALLVGRAVATLYADYLWFSALGATDVWRVRTITLLLLRGLSAVAGGLFVFANLLAVRHSVVSVVLPRRVANLEIGQEVPGRYLLLAVVALSVLFGALLTIPQGDWATAALVAYGRRFGFSEPYFQYDIGFFVYWLPFETSLFLWALLAVLLVGAVVVFLYALTPSLRWERGSLYVSAYVRRHLAVLAALLLVMLAWSYRLDAFQVLVDGSGPDGAFTYVDHRVTIPASLVMQVLALGAALVTLLSGWGGFPRVAVGTVVAMVLLSLGLRELAPIVVRRVAEPADPAARERPYLATQASYTRNAYGAERVALAPPDFGFPSLEAAASAVPIWEPAAVTRALGAGPRPGAPAEAVGWIDGERGLLAAVPARPRGTSAAESWPLSLVAATRADERGGVIRVDSTGQTYPEELELAAPLFHEGARGDEIVVDSLGAIAAPPLRGALSRLVHAWSLQNPRLLAGDLPGPNARILRHRDVRERLRLLVPFFDQGGAVTPVVDGDSIWWAIELHTASGSYPLSRHLAVRGVERTYYRYAATALVNATTGRVTIVPDSAADPIARSWMTRFPSLFASRGALPPAVRAALPPPVDALRAQAAAFARVGSRTLGGSGRHTPEPADVEADSVIAAGGRTVLGPLPGGAGPLWTVPVLDVEDRVVGLVAGEGGASGRSWWMPLEGRGQRWTAVLDALGRSPDADGARETAVTRGRVRAVPVDGRIVWVQPFYSWRATPGPTLARTSVLVADSARVGRTFADAVGLAPPGGPIASLPPGDLRAQAGALYDEMSAALRRGDLRAFGAAWERLGRLLGRAPRSP